jgi:REP element-mobilizing transposase RayT
LETKQGDIFMAIATHCIWGAYGFWLPNDPRGSGSTFVGSHAIWEAGGEATLVHASRSLAHQNHDRQLRMAGKVALRKPAMRFTDAHINAIGVGFAAAVRIGNYNLYACAIMPDHVHIVAGHPPDLAAKIVAHLKSFGTKEINRRGLNPYAALQGRDGQRVWADRFRHVFLSAADLPRCVQYVRDNPIKAGLPAQNWNFLRAWAD